MEKLKIGDVVILKSGGLSMTVKWTIDNLVGCTWFSKNSDNSWEGPYDFEFAEDQLVLVELTSNQTKNV